MIVSNPSIVTREAAEAAGLKRYFTGIPCRNGHIAERRMGNDECVECRALADDRRRKKISVYHRARYAANKERWREYAATNRERIKKRRTHRLKRSRERVNAVAREWRRRNRDERNEQQRAFYWENRKKIRKAQAAYNRTNPESARRAARTRRMTMRGLRSDYNSSDVATLLEKQQQRCAICFGKIRGYRYEVDHIVPIARGGLDVFANIQITHRRCNNRKRAKDPIDFARELGRLL